jgi:hypothetical protein
MHNKSLTNPQRFTTQRSLVKGTICILSSQHTIHLVMNLSPREVFLFNFVILKIWQFFPQNCKKLIEFILAKFFFPNVFVEKGNIGPQHIICLLRSHFSIESLTHNSFFEELFCYCVYNKILRAQQQTSSGF